MRFPRFKKAKPYKVDAWRVEIFYPLAEIIKIYEVKDPLDALKKGVQDGLIRHGLVTPDAFNMVWSVLLKENRDPATGQLWFRLKKV